MTIAAVSTLDAVLDFFTMRGPLPTRMPVEIPNVTRLDLAKLFAHLGFTHGAEIGVQRGEYSEILCQANPSLHLTCVDPWTVRADYDNGRDTQADFHHLYLETTRRLSPYNADIIRTTSMEAVKHVRDGSLDFVYIDGHHNFQNVTNDICEWTKKVRVGGIIAGDDYYKTAKPVHGLHVQHVVDAFTDAYGIRPWFVLGRKQAEPDEARDRHRSFFWVRSESPLDSGH
jgi:hypothetical protein